MDTVDKEYIMPKLSFLQQAINRAVAVAYAAGYECGLEDAASAIATSAMGDRDADAALDEIDKIEHIGQGAYRTDEYLKVTELPDSRQLEFSLEVR